MDTDRTGSCRAQADHSFSFPFWPGVQCRALCEAGSTPQLSFQLRDRGETGVCNEIRDNHRWPGQEGHSQAILSTTARRGSPAPTADVWLCPQLFPRGALPVFTRYNCATNAEHKYRRQDCVKCQNFPYWTMGMKNASVNTPHISSGKIPLCSCVQMCSGSVFFPTSTFFLPFYD